jgi:AAA15 family ATPase/GTPase
MIAKFIFSNFYSFAEETEVSFEVGKQPSSSLYDVELADGRRFNKIIAVIGANGSGKTQLLRPLAFLSWFATSSFFSEPKEKIPFKPHALKENKDSYLEVFFTLHGIDYKYKLIINKNHVVHESLYKKTSMQYSYIFIRELNESGIYKFKQKSFGFPAKLAENIKSNVSIISAAHTYGIKSVIEFEQFFDNFNFNVNTSGRNHYSENHLFSSAEYFYENNAVKDRMLEIICDLDLGLSSVKLEEIKGENDGSESEKFYLPIGVHSINGVEFSLSFLEESSGTQSAFVLLRRILPILENGGVAIIDEIDNDLHPHMLPKLLELFKFQHTNPHNAQIIFSCHTPEILNILKKHQVYLVEKNNLISEAWRLDEVTGLRADDNIFAKYNAGALGAVPNI